ncbi:hypothetical protein [Curtobacterium sp. MCBA15_004]|nr:hypothetical protein [Curtobacterium sp. MCBA15_004]WIA95836.1 hypothetical protein QOL16_12025 [Curtobacterium sp. MCBA15_004]
MTGHGILCACTACSTNEEHDYWSWHIEQDGKAIARAAEHEFVSDCD